MIMNIVETYQLKSKEEISNEILKYDNILTLETFYCYDPSWFQKYQDTPLYNVMFHPNKEELFKKSQIIFSRYFTKQYNNSLELEQTVDFAFWIIINIFGEIFVFYHKARFACSQEIEDWKLMSTCNCFDFLVKNKNSERKIIKKEVFDYIINYDQHTNINEIIVDKLFMKDTKKVPWQLYNNYNPSKYEISELYKIIKNLDGCKKIDINNLF